jgi:putative oxidoreductase
MEPSDFRARVRAILDGSEPIAQLVARLTVGVVFLTSGWGKVQHLDKVIAFFTELKIPAPHLQAPFVAYTELVCGALLLVGLAARLAALPLMVIMLVAIASAKRGEIHGVSELVALNEWAYFALLLWITTRGPGPIAVDRFLGRARARSPGA